MLSPATATTRTGKGLPFDPVMIYSDVSSVATSSISAGGPPDSSVVRTFYFPATSASEIAARRAPAAADAAAAVSPAARSSAFRSWPQPASRAVQQQENVTTRIPPPRLRMTRWAGEADVGPAPGTSNTQ